MATATGVHFEPTVDSAPTQVNQLNDDIYLEFKDLKIENSTNAVL